VALAMNAPMQVSSSISLISLAMNPPQERLRQNHNWEQELWFRDVRRLLSTTEALPRLPLPRPFWRSFARWYVCRRWLHGAGGWQRAAADQFVSLPADGPLAIRYRRVRS
jgi:hypothetical protein